jgi:two-component system chemotaxis response regulator CheY
MAFSVMIVDDSPAMRAFVRRVLHLSGFPVEEYLLAGNGKEALELLQSRTADIILTDINMPTMDGEQFVRRLEADECLRAIPVVVVSTDASETRIREMLALGARGYVKKPFAPEALRDELERVLGGACAA